MNDLSPEQRQLALRFADVALPCNVIDCDTWEWHDGRWRRYFTVKSWHVGDIEVCVSGEQDHGGRARFWTYLGSHALCTTADRENLIAALLEAGDLLDSLERPER